MPQKFIAFQIVLITFGIALFFALADLKKKNMQIRQEVQSQVVVENCDFSAWVGKRVNAAALKKTGLFPLIVLSDLQQPDTLAIGNKEDAIIVRVDDHFTVVGVECP